MAASKSIPRKYVTVATFREMTGLGMTKVYDLLNAGHLIGVRVGRRTLIDAEAGLAWLASNRWTPLSSRLER